MMAPNRRYELSTEFRTPSRGQLLAWRSELHTENSPFEWEEL